MKIAKPNDVLLLLGCQSIGGQPRLTITIGYACHIDGTRLSEQQAWAWLAPQFCNTPFDLGEKKQRGTYAVAGSACAPAGQTCSGMMIRAGVGSLPKSLAVLGHRRWRRNRMRWSSTPPEPFERMPIDLAQAYGASDWRHNPHGIGHFSNIDDALGARLPNVEDPGHPVQHPSDVPPVATLGPLPVASPERLQWLGALDDTWKRDRHPWLPDSVDPRWFDRVPQDQCQSCYWRGDEPWFAENMHPVYTTMRGQLPGLRPRLLIRQDTAPQQRREVPLDLDTVWLFPTDERLVVLSRGVVSTRREDAEDILALAVFTERLVETPQPAAYWAQRWQEQDERNDTRTPSPAPSSASKTAMRAASVAAIATASGTATPNTTPSTTPAAAAFEQSVREKIQTAQQALITEAERLAQQYGLSPLPPRPTTVDGAASHIRMFSRDPATFVKAVQTHIAQQRAAAEAAARATATAHGLDYDQFLSRAQSATSPSTPDDPASLLAMAKGLWPAEKAERLAAEFRVFERKIAAIEAQADDLRRQNATRKTPLSGDSSAPSFSTHGRTPLNKTTLVERYAAGQSCAWTSLTDLDLSGLSLGGIDLSNALLLRCTLRDSHLDLANFQGAELHDCDLTAAALRHATLHRTQLTQSVLNRVQAEGADFTQARLSSASLAHATLDNTRWSEAQVNECGFAHTRMPQVHADHARFKHCDFTATDAQSGAFQWAIFEHCTLEDATFGQALLANATLLACQASRIALTRARLPGLRVLKGTNLTQAHLDKALLTRASLQNSSFAFASLRETQMDHSLIKNCDLTGTDAWHLVARSVNFSGSRVVDASWRGANLMQTRWNESVLQDTDMTGVNLHAADTRRVQAQGVQLAMALMTRCRLLDHYRPARSPADVSRSRE